jgi:ubiquinone/menaquinone biosynthesis C-methylase UbiE
MLSAIDRSGSGAMAGIDGKDMTRRARELENSDFARRFDEVAASFDGIVSKYSAIRRYHALIPLIRGKVLDAGAGTGWLSRLYDPKEIIHLDISINMCRVVHEKTGSPAICGDAEILPVTDEAFDTIVSSEMIYYLNEPNRFFSEASRSLKPGGRLLITSANQKAAFYDRCRTFLRRIGVTRAYFDDGTNRFMTDGEMKRLYEENGFKVIMCRNIMILPFRFFRRLDCRLEKTPFSRFALYLVMAGLKTGRSDDVVCGKMETAGGDS